MTWFKHLIVIVQAYSFIYVQLYVAEKEDDETNYKKQAENEMKKNELVTEDACD